MMKLRINPPVAEAEPEPAAGEEPAAAAEPAEAPPPPPPGVDWEPLVESDSDGDVRQPSFILPATMLTDEAGVPSVRHPDCQGVAEKYTKYQERVGSVGQVAEEEFRRMGLGLGGRPILSIRDSDTGPIDDSPDWPMIKAFLQRQAKEFSALNELEPGKRMSELDRVVDKIVQLVLDGITRPRVGIGRPF